jgi:hypothetical protein
MQDPSELKGLALQIAAQLPNDRQAALKILDFVREVVEWRAPARSVPEPTSAAGIYVLRPGSAGQS